MPTDPFASLRKADTGRSTSFREHLEHAEPSPVFLAKPRISAVAHQEHPEHLENAERWVKPLWDEEDRFGAACHPDQVIGIITPDDYALIPTQWHDGLKRLNLTQCPAWLEQEWWRRFVMDAFRFAWEFGEDAVAAGWSTRSLFGANGDPALICLVADIRGDRVVNLFKDERGRDVASILNAEGNRRWHHRQMPDDAPLLWDADPRKTARKEG